MKRTFIPALLSISTLTLSATAQELPAKARTHCDSFVVRPLSAGALVVRDRTEKLRPIAIGAAQATAGLALGTVLWPVGITLGIPLAIGGAFDTSTNDWAGLGLGLGVAGIVLPVALATSGWQERPEARVLSQKLYFADAAGQPVCKISLKGNQTDFVNNLQEQFSQAAQNGQCVAYDSTQREFSVVACPQM